MMSAVAAEKYERKLLRRKNHAPEPRSFKGNEILDHLVGNPKTHIFHVDEGTCFTDNCIPLNHDLTDNDGNKYRICEKCFRDHEIYDIIDALCEEGNSKVNIYE